ncbi:MAG: nucleotidyltransferase domain-containing protein [Acidobacteria bacterium]|nr:nucleotidyltransferase domain-containing protein [Acidobacteriota bacterium]
MTPDEYVSQVLQKYKDSENEILQVETLAESVSKDLTVWANDCLSSISFSGAFAKGTTVKGSSDIDLFISLKSSTSNSLKEIYESLLDLASEKNWNPRPQNVSVRIIQGNYKIDLVPAKKQSNYQNWHSLYKSKTETWTQTNVASHILTVQNSNRIDEIRAIKIWRNLNNLEFPSFYLELTVINALYGKRRNIAENVLAALNYIAKYFPNLRVIDPANTNNVISNDLSSEEKSYIAQVAKASASQSSWGSIIW